MPTEMKKRLMNASRNGMMSLSAWWLYSDSEMARPAMKAPSASDRPAMGGEPGGAQADEDDGQDEELAASGLDDLLEDPGHQEPGAVMGGQDDGGRLGADDQDLLQGHRRRRPEAG